jgi:hypothetical protein
MSLFTSFATLWGVIINNLRAVDWPGKSCMKNNISFAAQVSSSGKAPIKNVHVKSEPYEGLMHDQGHTFMFFTQCVLPCILVYVFHLARRRKSKHSSRVTVWTLPTKNWVMWASSHETALWRVVVFRDIPLLGVTFLLIWRCYWKLIQTDRKTSLVVGHSESNYLHIFSVTLPIPVTERFKRVSTAGRLLGLRVRIPVAARSKA